MTDLIIASLAVGLCSNYFQSQPTTLNGSRANKFIFDDFDDLKHDHGPLVIRRAADQRSAAEIATR
jgi:hypothetical protein